MNVYRVQLQVHAIVTAHSQREAELKVEAGLAIDSHPINRPSHLILTAAAPLVGADLASLLDVELDFDETGMTIREAVDQHRERLRTPGTREYEERQEDAGQRSLPGAGRPIMSDLTDVLVANSKRLREGKDV